MVRFGRIIVASGLLVIAATGAIAQDESLPAAGGGAAPPTDSRHYSYAIGLDVGASFKKDQLELDVDSLVQGLKDGLAGADPKYADEVCAAAMVRLNQIRSEGLSKKNKDFLAANAQAAGVKTTKSGLQYKALESGDGPSPGPEDTVKVHYRGKLIDGTVFDESYEGGQPISFPVGAVIAGWTEALQLMKVGDKWELTIPSELAYGERGAGDVIPPHATLVFEVELLGVEGK